MDGQVSLFGPDLPCGRTLSGSTPAAGPPARIFRRSSRRSFGWKNHRLMVLDLRPGAGNMLGPCWEYDPPWLGSPGTLNTSESPRGGAESSLSRILLPTVPRKYYLSRRACLGILRRARQRGKTLPEKLERALKIQAGLIPAEPLSPDGAAGFCAGASPTAGSTGWQEEVSPTLKAASGGNMMPSVLCLNDQGGARMDVSGEISGTLRAQEHGHQPLLFENHGIAGRYRGPLEVAPTLAARIGTGGNNAPIVSQDTEYPVFSRQRVDKFQEDEITSTQSARQYKDTTDLVLTDTAGLDCRNGKENGDLYGTLQASGSGQSLNSVHPIRTGLLLRRLHPTEAERLQGFPDDWTKLPGASDSARFRGLGNSVSVPCVEHLMQGIALALRAPPELCWFRFLSE